MNTRVLFFLIIAGGALSLAQVAAIITTTSPYSAGSEVLWSFFIFSFFALTAIGSLIWYAIKRTFIYRINPPSLFRVVRQVSILSLVTVLVLLFSSLGVLSVWEVVPLYISAALIEFFFQADKQSPSSSSSLS